MLVYVGLRIFESHETSPVSGRTLPLPLGVVAMAPLHALAAARLPYRTNPTGPTPTRRVWARPGARLGGPDPAGCRWPNSACRLGTQFTPHSAGLKLVLKHSGATLHLAQISGTGSTPSDFGQFKPVVITVQASCDRTKEPLKTDNSFYSTFVCQKYVSTSTAPSLTWLDRRR